VSLLKIPLVYRVRQFISDTFEFQLHQDLQRLHEVLCKNSFNKYEGFVSDLQFYLNEIIYEHVLQLGEGPNVLVGDDGVGRGHQAQVLVVRNHNCLQNC